MKSIIELKNIGLEFKVFEDKSATLKETIVNKLLNKKIGACHSFWALKNINLNINAGERVGIIGNNGAGKSSLLKVLTRIYRPTIGVVNVCGNIVPLIELGAGFNPELSGYENIFLNGSVMGYSKKVMKPKIDNIIRFAELEEFIHMPVKYYSTGMAMRLAFSIATDVSADILIIDEVFAGGDINFVKKATDRMNDLIDKSSIVIMVSHSLELIEQTSNRVILLEKGQIVADGEPKEVISYYRTRG